MTTSVFNWVASGWANANKYTGLSPYLSSMMSFLTSSNPGSKNLGGYVKRGAKGTPSSPSAHAFGAAIDWGYKDRGQADRTISMIMANPGGYGIQEIHDYDRMRVWYADRGWVQQRQGSHGGDMKPGSKWLHFEVHPDWYQQKFSAQPQSMARGFMNQPGSWAPAITPSAQLGQGIHWGNQKLSREQIAQVAYQAGFRGQTLTNMVAIAWRESGGNAQLYVNRPSTGDWSYGLWGLNVGKNSQYWPMFQKWGFNSPDELRTPEGNARAAYMMYQAQGDRPWGPYKGKPATYSTDVGAAQKAVDNAAASGLLGVPWGNVQMSDMGVFGSTAPIGPIQLPTDARVYRTAMGLSAVFDVGGVAVEYGIDWWDPNSVDLSGVQITNVSAAQWNQIMANGVNGGNARELGTIRSTYGTYGEFWNTILGQTIGYNNPAAKDPGVMRVLAEFAGRPDMSEAELQNKLKATEYWNSRTEAQLEWNGLSEAEKQSRNADMFGRMDAAWMQYTGQPDIPNEQWGAWIGKLASGETNFAWWIENVVKPVAEQNPESPWKRQAREEVEQQRARGVDIENTTNQVRDTLNRWGLQWDQNTLNTWARGIVEKTHSDADLLEEIKNQAQALYPWKDRETDTATAAQPWIQTYARVMEKDGSVFTPEVQQALQASQTAWDFEQSLKKSSAWMGTNNGQKAMYDAVGGLGRTFGYV